MNVRRRVNGPLRRFESMLPGKYTTTHTHTKKKKEKPSTRGKQIKAQLREK